MSFKILVVDDKIDNEKDSIAELPVHLRAAGYEVISTPVGKDAYDLFWKHNPALIVLDIELGSDSPNGIEICQSIRDNDFTVPIILITSVKHETKHLLRGFEVGANDYVRLPLDHREILARIRANLPSEVIVIDDCILIDFAARQLWICKDGKPQNVHLQPLEFDLLQLLVNNAGRVLTKTIIEDKIWDKDISVDLLRVFIHRLRKKLEPDPSNPKYIEAVINRGYRFNGQPVPYGRSKLDHNYCRG